jgi:hypothetical protein
MIGTGWRRALSTDGVHEQQYNTPSKRAMWRQKAPKVSRRGYFFFLLSGIALLRD